MLRSSHERHVAGATSEGGVHAEVARKTLARRACTRQRDVPQVSEQATFGRANSEVQRVRGAASRIVLGGEASADTGARERGSEGAPGARASEELAGGPASIGVDRGYVRAGLDQSGRTVRHMPRAHGSWSQTIAWGRCRSLSYARRVERDPVQRMQLGDRHVQGRPIQTSGGRSIHRTILMRTITR
jgi:hypothetical protein